MTAFIVLKDPPQVMTNLSAIAAVKGISLIWDKDTGELDERTTRTEIWMSLTNDRSAASLVATVNGDNWVNPNVTTGEDRYYWVRGKDIEARLGDWNAGSTAGVLATGAEAQTADLAPGSTTQIGGYLETNIENLTAAYGTWQEFASDLFTTPDDVLAGEFTVECAWQEMVSTVEAAPLSGETLTIDMLIELDRITAPAGNELTLTTQRFNFEDSSGHSVTGIADGSTNFTFPFSGLDPDVQYEMKISLRRTRTSTGTITYSSLLRTLTQKVFKR